MTTAVLIDYTNHRGERRWRRILPLHLWHGQTEHHVDPQWLLRATDLERGEERVFAMRQVHGWREER